MKDICLVSLDVSTKKTGYAIFKNGNYSLSGLISYEKEKDLDERLRGMSMNILSVLDIYKPQIISIEDTYCGRNPSVQKSLNRLQGVIYGWAVRNNADFNLYLPTQWRKYIDEIPTKGKRNDLKEKAIEYAVKKYKEDINDDEAEAICIGEATLKMYEEA